VKGLDAVLFLASRLSSEIINPVTLLDQLRRIMRTTVLVSLDGNGELGMKERREIGLRNCRRRVCQDWCRGADLTEFLASSPFACPSPSYTGSAISDSMLLYSCGHIRVEYVESADKSEVSMCCAF
jgi:hypothetical protein